MTDLLDHHIRTTETSFKEVKEDLKELNAKMDELKEFKIALIASSRWISMVVSAVCGFATLVASTIVTYYINQKLK